MLGCLYYLKYHLHVWLQRRVCVRAEWFAAETEVDWLTAEDSHVQHWWGCLPCCETCLRQGQSLISQTVCLSFCHSVTQEVFLRAKMSKRMTTVKMRTLKLSWSECCSSSMSVRCLRCSTMRYVDCQEFWRNLIDLLMPILLHCSSTRRSCWSWCSILLFVCSLAVEHNQLSCSFSVATVLDLC